MSALIEAAREIASLRAALKWYADGEHFTKLQPDAWDTVSGEPVNWWYDEAGTAMIEDGTLAGMVLAGKLSGEQLGALEDGEVAAAEAQPTELEAMVDKAWSRFEAEDQRLKVKKSERGHALVNAGHFPGMSEAFDAHMGAACWTDPAYAPDASTWAAAWRASKAQPVGEPVAWGGLTEGERAQAVQSIFEYGTGFVAPLFAVIEGVERTLERRNTAPPAQPAREPLTDEQISELFKSWRVGSLYMHIARGVERAHGIGEGA